MDHGQLSMVAHKVHWVFAERMPWPWPPRISRVMPSARIPNGIGTRDARSWVSNPSLGAMT
jgi:hypothetical protein